MKYWKLDLPHTPALDLARQMLEDCLKAYEVPAEGENEACRIVCAVAPDPALPPGGLPYANSYGRPGPGG